MCLQVPMCVCEWGWRPEVSDTVPLGFETGSLACTCGSPRSLWARPGICQSLPLQARISSMHLVMLKLKTEFRAPCLHSKHFTPKLDPQSKSWVLKVGFRSLANAGAKGQSFIPQLKCFGESNLGGMINKDFSRGWEHPQMRDNEAVFVSGNVCFIPWTWHSPKLSRVSKGYLQHTQIPTSSNFALPRKIKHFFKSWHPTSTQMFRYGLNWTGLNWVAIFFPAWISCLLGLECTDGWTHAKSLLDIMFCFVSWVFWLKQSVRHVFIGDATFYLWWTWGHMDKYIYSQHI